MRDWLWIGLLTSLLVGLAGCTAPPASSYYKAEAGAQGSPIGANTTGESCAMLNNQGGGADIFCGAWSQPSARIRPAAGGSDLMGLATNSPWRAELESRFACGDPKPDTATTLVLQCTRRAGGWAQIALVTEAGGKIWLADGTPAAFPVIRRAINQLSGGAATTTDAPVSADIASYLAARAFSAGDISQYESLMQAGLQANLAGRPDNAESAYRAALALQEKAQGADSPAAAAAMMSLAVAALRPRPVRRRARLFHARREAPAGARRGRGRQQRAGPAGALSRHPCAQPGQPETGRSSGFRQAERAYRQIAPDAPDVRAGAGSRRQPFSVAAGRVSLGDALGSSQAFATLSQREAILGILESRRNLAVALRCERRRGRRGARKQPRRPVRAGQ